MNGSTPLSRVRHWKPAIVQLLVLVALALTVGLAVRTAMQKIAAQQTASGFGFLSNTAGFDISESVLAFDSQMSYGRAILAGFVNTLAAAAIAVIVATALGVAIGIARLSSNLLLRNVSLGISEVIRNVPLLLQLLVWYALILNVSPGPRAAHPVLGVWITNRGLFLPTVLDTQGRPMLAGLLVGLVVWLCLYIACMRWRGARRAAGLMWWRSAFAAVAVAAISCCVQGARVSWPNLEGFNIGGGMSLSPEMTALIAGLAVYAAAFIGEVVRSGILSVPTGQKEAAYAIGLSPLHRIRLVIFPQALRLILPPLSNIYLSLAKNTSLGVAIGFPDLSSVIATSINQSGQAVEGVLIQVAAYLAISVIVWTAVNLYERHTRYDLR